MARRNHSSVAIGSIAYVFGGTGNNRSSMNSLERLSLSDEYDYDGNLKPRDWSSFNIESLSPREDALMMTTSHSEVIILGGFNRGGLFSDGVVLDVSMKRVSKQISSGALKFSCTHN